MNPSSEDLKDKLESEGSFGVFGADIFIGTIPDKPNNILVLTDALPDPPQGSHDRARPLFEFDACQLLVRDMDYLDGWKKLQSAILYLRKLERWVVDPADGTPATRYEQIAVRNGIFFTGKDEKKRNTFTATLKVIRTTT